MDPERDAELRGHLDVFARLMRSEADAVPLDEAALRISAVLQTGLDVLDAHAALDELAASCPSPTREGVVDHLCNTLGYRGNRNDYADWRNSCLDRVLETRHGIPITLSILVIEVARRVGVRLVGIGMPAHFLVGDPEDPGWFADPFGEGRILTRADCRRILTEIGRGRIPWEDRHLEPTPSRAVVTRITNNLREAFAQRRDPIRLALTMRIRALIPDLSWEQDEAARAQAVFN